MSPPDQQATPPPPGRMTRAYWAAGKTGLD